MTERQLKIYDFLSAIALSPNLEINFENPDRLGGEEVKNSYAKRRGDMVSLYLKRVDDDKDLSEWEEVIIQADKMLTDLKRAEEYEANHPDFTTSVRRKIYLLKKYK